MVQSKAKPYWAAAFLWIAATISSVTNCIHQVKPTAFQTEQTRKAVTERSMPEIEIEGIHRAKAFYKPGELAEWQLIVNSEGKTSVPLTAVTQISDAFGEDIEQLVCSADLGPGKQLLNLKWQIPQAAPLGYVVSMRIFDPEKNVLAEALTSINVLENWTQMPLYGFLTDYGSERKNIAQDMQALADFQINGLQFYDWMYRHEQLLTDQEPYTDILGRKLSFKTVEALIDSAHEKGIAAMPYTAIYGSSIEFYRAHPDWALFDKNGKPSLFGDNFMAVMDPRSDSPWTLHLQEQFAELLKKTKFDGIHLDQYGSPTEAYTQYGQAYDMKAALADSINLTRQTVEKYRPKGAVIFNAVTAWPLKEAGESDEDVIYIEVWPPYTHYADLHQVITEAQALGTQKPVIIAAYVHPENNAGVLLSEAIVFASGATRIELGEKLNYLADPYFPKYESLSSDQLRILRQYYSFIVAYQSLLGAQAKDQTDAWLKRLQIDGLSISKYAAQDKILPVVREIYDSTTLSLVNLYGLSSPDWQKFTTEPQLKTDLRVRIKLKGRVPKAVRFASPDRTDWHFSSIPYTVEADTLTLTIDCLRYWDLINILWENQEV